MILEVTKGHKKCRVFENSQVSLDSFKNQQLQGFLRAHGLSYMGLVATIWVQWVLKYPYCHQMITTNLSFGQETDVGKNRIFENSIAFGKCTAQRIYPEQCTPKQGKTYIYCLKHASHSLDDHSEWPRCQMTKFRKL